MPCGSSARGFRARSHTFAAEPSRHGRTPLSRDSVPGPTFSSASRRLWANPTEAEQRAMGESWVPEQSPERRIRHARETQAALNRIMADRSPENVAALHRLLARHLREDGDHARAVEADARAERVLTSTSRPEDHPKKRPPE